MMTVHAKCVCAKYERPVERDERHIVPSSVVAYVLRLAKQRKEGK